MIRFPCIVVKVRANIFCSGQRNSGRSPAVHHGLDDGGGDLQRPEDVLAAGLRGGFNRPRVHGLVHHIVHHQRSQRRQRIPQGLPPPTCWNVSQFFGCS